MRGEFILVWSLATLAACEGRRSVDASVPSLPELDFSEATSVGGAEAVGAAAFGLIRAAALLADGPRIVVADGQTQELHLFSLSGDHLRTIGGRGGGPGEFQAIRKVWGRPDGGFCTWDVQTTRVTRFDSAGDLVGTSRAELDDMESIRPSFQGFLDDCGFILRDERSTMGMRDVPEGMRRDTVRFVLFAPDGSMVRTLATRLDGEKWFRNRDRSWGHVSLVFGDELFGFAVWRELWLGLSDSLRWERLDLAGERVGRVDLPFTSRPASDADVEQERQRRLAEVRDRSLDLPIGPPDLVDRMTETRRAGIREVPARHVMPAYDAVTPGPGGVVWIRQYPDPTDEDVDWLLLGPDGRLEGKVSLARDEELLAASNDVLLVSSTDSLDVPVLRILTRGRS